MSLFPRPSLSLSLSLFLSRSPSFFLSLSLSLSPSFFLSLKRKKQNFLTQSIASVPPAPAWMLTVASELSNSPESSLESSKSSRAFLNRET
jgi:hypothetical protein